jgi:glutamyl-tRNA reductase
MRVGVVGINHKLASLELREVLARCCRQLFGIDSLLFSEQQFVFLSTCNRTEIYFSSVDLAQTHSYILQLLRAVVDEDFEQKIYSFFGIDCFMHLVRVTAGLDSALVAETEIQGQVCMAYQQAMARSTLAKEQHFIFQKALHLGKTVRHRHLNQYGRLSLEAALWQLCRQRVEHPCELTFLCLGASQTNRRILSYLQAKGCCSLYLCNRSLDHAEALAETVGAVVIPWEMRHQWREYQVVITATTAPHWLLYDSADVKMITQIAFDLSVPRNIQPDIGKKIDLFDIDQVQMHVQEQQSNRQQAVIAAESYLENTVQRHYVAWQKRMENTALFSCGVA